MQRSSCPGPAASAPGLSIAQVKPLLARITLAVMLACMALAGVTPLATSLAESPSAAIAPAHSRLPDEYFAKAVLIGDSLADGLSIHGVIPPLQLLSRIGLSPRSAMTEKLFKSDGKSVTIVEKLPDMRASIVYLWLGSNGLVHKDAGQVLGDYGRLLTRLKAAAPDALFYLLEVTPVMLLTQENYEGFTNERIDAFNEGLRELAGEHGAYVLAINQMLRDEAGLLAEPYQAKDGIHLQKDAYALIAEYLYTHAAEVVSEESHLENQ